MNIRFINPGESSRVCQAINADPEFRLASRLFSRDILLTIGEIQCLIKIRDGAVVEIKHDPTFMNPWSFFIKGSADAWGKFLQPIPPPTYTDLYGAIARRHFEIGGDIEAAFAHFWAVTRMLEIFRELENGAPPAAKYAQPQPRAGQIEPVVGKYVYLNIHGLGYRVYFEECGSGIPVICQHTAASDGRLWRHLLNDAEVTEKLRVIVPDLPYHGKSLPPESMEWWKQEYRLTKRFFMDFHLELSRALILDRPVFMGCSMGGQLAVELAIEHPDEFRAVIGLESGLSRARMAPTLDFHDHPRISNEFRMQSMYGKTAPGNPEHYRREIAWTYGQSAPPVSKGDLYYNFIDHNLTGGEASRIDTSRIAVYLMTGEYDWGNSPDQTRILAEQIKGSKFVEMKGLGHFPMAENFSQFKSYLMPILHEIAAESAMPSR
jgi:pimeloyl-ACP methyl ester carboxylesterase